MKTVEEKAMEFTKNRKNVVGLPVNDLWIFEEGFVEGYIEATRWRDPKQELPKDEQVLVKTDKDKILLVTYWVEKGDFVYWDAPVYNVIGWRPIE